VRITLPMSVEHGADGLGSWYFTLGAMEHPRRWCWVGHSPPTSRLSGQWRAVEFEDRLSGQWLLQARMPSTIAVIAKETQKQTPIPSINRDPPPGRRKPLIATLAEISDNIPAHNQRSRFRKRKSSTVAKSMSYFAESRIDSALDNIGSSLVRAEEIVRVRSRPVAHPRYCHRELTTNVGGIPQISTTARPNLDLTTKLEETADIKPSGRRAIWRSERRRWPEDLESSDPTLRKHGEGCGTPLSGKLAKSKGRVGHPPTSFIPGLKVQTWGTLPFGVGQTWATRHNPPESHLVIEAGPPGSRPVFTRK
jgi:hypothetical protein